MSNRKRTIIYKSAKHAWKNKKVGFLAALFLFLILSGGLLARSPYVAFADVDLGYVNYFSDRSLPRYEPFEPLPDIESFIQNNVLYRAGSDLGKQCTAEGAMQLRPVLKISCKGQGEDEVRSYVKEIARAITERHNDFYVSAKKSLEYRSETRNKSMALLEKEIEDRVSAGNKDRQEGDSIYKLKRDLAVLQESHNEFQLLGPKVVKTALRDSSFVVEKRGVSPLIWLTVFCICVLSGFLASLLYAAGNGVALDKGEDKRPL